ncbi:MAG: hypothetical protein VKK59_03415 [Vampirovibrionales bacterium]|nr:hypothetical protein [Vampirovibrionales bacterium]
MADLPTSSRLVDAYIKVADDVNRSIILTALRTKTPVIVSDDQGNILRLDAKELAKEYGIEE